MKAPQWMLLLVGSWATMTFLFISTGWIAQLPFVVRGILAFGSWNLITFAAFGWDKLMGGRIKDRIPEKVFFVSAALGGAPGILLASKAFHHKSSERKKEFRKRVWWWLAADILVIVLVLYIILF